METEVLQTQKFRVDGMFCTNCQTLIEKKLKNTDGVHDAVVSYKKGTAVITYDSSAVSINEMISAVDSEGYKMTEAAVDDKSENKNITLQIAGTLVIIIALSVLLRLFSTSGIAAAFPVAQMGMGYGMLFVIGLLSSVHCIGMCGGINLSQTLGSGGVFSSLLYNGGRLISYTAVGAAVGALGSVVTLTGRFQGTVQLTAGIFMLIMGINMLGLFPSLRRLVPSLPKIFSEKIGGQKTGRGPLIVGFLNGFMPCGPLQAMQIYALGTGSPVRGGISMFLFCLGTIPLMYALGAASGILSGVKGRTFGSLVFSRRVMHIGAVLVAALGLTMLSNGWSLAGFNSPVNRITQIQTASAADGAAAIQNGVQIVNSTLLPSRYPAIAVQQGIPVRWTINAPPGSINGCNNRMIIREYGIEYTFKQGENVIEFMPEKTGRFSYSCWMGMIRSSITVVAEGESLAGVPEPDTAPKPAGVDIPTGAIAVAQIMEDYQTVEILLTDDGFQPAIIVVQRWLPAIWNINIESYDPGNSLLVFPSYYARIETEQGDNPIQLIPMADFDFSTGDNIFYGYVKVVDDINDVDMDAVKAEVAVHETLMYPQAYFEISLDAGG